MKKLPKAKQKWFVIEVNRVIRDMLRYDAAFVEINSMSDVPIMNEQELDERTPAKVYSYDLPTVGRWESFCVKILKPRQVVKLSAMPPVEKLWTCKYRRDVIEYPYPNLKPGESLDDLIWIRFDALYRTA